MTENRRDFTQKTTHAADTETRHAEYNNRNNIKNLAGLLTTKVTRMRRPFFQKRYDTVLELPVTVFLVHHDMGAAFYHLAFRAFRQAMKRGAQKVIIHIRIPIAVNDKRRGCDPLQIDHLYALLHKCIFAPASGARIPIVMPAG